MIAPQLDDCELDMILEGLQLLYQQFYNSNNVYSDDFGKQLLALRLKLVRMHNEGARPQR